jgi:acyl-CoA dehydrogenase
MDLKESPEIGAFRKEVREWTLANMPPPESKAYDYRGLEDDDNIGPWFRKLADKGWLAYRWPEEYGGPGFSEAEKVVFIDELLALGAPIPHGFGINMVGPLIYQFGTEAQKRRFLPKIAADTERWCQGYSEPNAGSDLAGLQTRAELTDDGKHFMLNGQKTWTSRASVAQWIFVLARTDPQAPKQQGISFFLVPMDSEGLSIRPIPQIDGRASFYETFFDNVKVPAENIVGEVNKGWSMAKALLEHERVNTGTNHDPTHIVEKVKHCARDYLLEGKPVLEDADFRERLAALEMDSDCLRYTRYRMATRVMRGEHPGPEASIFKLFQSELNQGLYDLALEAMGPDAASWYDKRLSPEAYDNAMAMTITRAMSIYSGSNEIQRNIIAKRVLQLPD